MQAWFHRTCLIMKYIYGDIQVLPLTLPFTNTSEEEVQWINKYTQRQKVVAIQRELITSI